MFRNWNIVFKTDAFGGIKLKIRRIWPIVFDGQIKIKWGFGNEGSILIALCIKNYEVNHVCGFTIYIISQTEQSPLSGVLIRNFFVLLINFGCQSLGFALASSTYTIQYFICCVERFPVTKLVQLLLTEKQTSLINPKIFHFSARILAKNWQFAHICSVLGFGFWFKIARSGLENSAIRLNNNYLWFWLSETIFH